MSSTQFKRNANIARAAINQDQDDLNEPCELRWNLLGIRTIPGEAQQVVAAYRHTIVEHSIGRQRIV